MKAYYGSRFSPNMTRTPEGFLICHNVPITRTGWYEYLGQELSLEDMIDKIVKVYKSPEEIFAPAAMASFEGKSVTDNHPSSDVRPDNYSSYEKGVVSNVRPGTDDESDCVVADLIIKDPNLISEIESGKREVSCGYNVDYEPIGDGKYQQANIRGNHVAIVSAGRAGDRISIKDEKPLIERRKSMKVDRNTIWGKMLSAFAKDADPEELAEAAKMTPEAEDCKSKDTLITPPAEPPKVTDEPPAENPAIVQLAKQVEDLTAVVSRLVQAQKVEEQPKDALDSLVAELESSPPASEEESVTIPAEQMSDQAPVTPPEERPDNPIPGADRNSILNAIKAVRPVIAAIKDPGERKKAADALAKTFRDQIATPAAPKETPGGYGGILQMQQANVTKALDNKPEDLTQLGKDIAKKFNPHYKEAK